MTSSWKFLSDKCRLPSQPQSCGVYHRWFAAGFVWLVSAIVVSCQECLLACLGGLLSLGLLSLENRLSWIPSNVSRIVFLGRGMGLHYSFYLVMHGLGFSTSVNSQ